MRSNFRIVVVSVILTVVCTGCTAMGSAESASCSIRGDVQSAAGPGNVSVLITDGTATLVGLVQSVVDANRAVRVAQDSGCVDRVIDHITVRN